MTQLTKTVNVVYMKKTSENLDSRKEAILEAAIKTFGKYGFKKTSITDIAEAAQFSKQGLYLHFPGKEQIFAEALNKYLKDGLLLVSEALAQPGTLYARILGAMEQWFGRHLLTFSPEAFDMIEAGHFIFKDEIEKFKAAFKAKIAKALADSQEMTEVCSPKDIAETLYLCGLSWKDERLSPADFKKKMGVCVRVCCRSEK